MPMKLYTQPRPTPMALRMSEEQAMTRAQTQTTMRECIRICAPVAFLLMYWRYTSYAHSEETAMHSAEPVEVMAMKSMMIIRMPPPEPMRAVAEAGGTRPVLASPDERATLRALPARPSEVASAKGMVNQTRPPRR